MAIENPFLVLRCLVLTCNEQVLRVGLVNYLKELERNHLRLGEVTADNGGGEDCDGECMEEALPFLSEPYEIANSLFEFSVFGKRLPDPNAPVELSEDEIDEQVDLFRSMLDTVTEEKREEENE